MKSLDFVLLHPSDSCAVAVRPIPSGSELKLPDGRLVVVRQDISAGHKVAIESIQADQPVRKYGWPIGLASQGSRLGNISIATICAASTRSIWRRSPPKRLPRRLPKRKDLQGVRSGGW